MAKDNKNNTSDQDNGPAVPARLRERFVSEVCPKLKGEFGLNNPMQYPKLEKIILNVNMGRHLEGTKVPANIRETILSTLTTISAQKPIVIKAKKSVSNFKVREGYETAAMVTLRRDRMWYFLDRLINLATPRIKDFRGLSETSFDQGGSYSMGLTEQGVFPEIDMARVNFTHGMNINLIFSNSNPALSRFVLTELGFPFRKPEEGRKTA